MEDKKERRKIKRDERRSRKKAEKDEWRINEWKRLDEMSKNDRREYKNRCRDKVENLFDNFARNMETIFHQADIDKLKELSTAVQQLTNSRVGSKEQLSSPWKRSGIHGIFVRDGNVKEVFEDKFSKRFFSYSKTTAYTSGRRIKNEEILLDIGNLILDEEKEDWFYIGIELIIITHQEWLSRRY